MYLCASFTLWHIYGHSQDLFDANSLVKNIPQLQLFLEKIPLLYIHPVTNVIGYMKPQKMSLFKNVRYNTKGKLGLVFFPLDHGLIETIQKWFLLNLVIFMIEIVLLMITMCRIITWKVLIMQIIWSVVVVSLQIIFLP